MIKPNRLQKGDTIAIVSLSKGLLGEPYMEYQRKIIESRLADFGLQVIYTPNALKGIEFIKQYPEVRAEDLKWAFANDEVRGIICAIGGDDTYKTVPYLLDDNNFTKLVKENPKIFIGYSDTTINHLMFYKLGLCTYYGHAAIVDFGELSKDMLPYSKVWFEKLFSPDGDIEIAPSPIWYLERTSFDASERGKDRASKKDTHGYEVLSGGGSVTGELFGGCIESLSELLSGNRYADEPQINEKYNLLPSRDELQGKILFLETSEEKPTPERLASLLKTLDNRGIFEAISGVIIGKPQNEAYYDEYKKVCTDIIAKYNKPILYNLNFGHAHPKCILPIGQKVTVDFDNKKVTLAESLAR